MGAVSAELMRDQELLALVSSHYAIPETQRYYLLDMASVSSDVTRYT